MDDSNYDNRINEYEVFDSFGERIENFNNQSDNNQFIYFMSLPVWKYIVLEFITLGIYNIVWFYKYWKAVKEAKQKKLSPFWRAFFGGLTCLSLFPIINENTQNIINSHYIEEENKYSDKSEYTFNAQLLAWGFLTAGISISIISHISKDFPAYNNLLNFLSMAFSFINLIIIVTIQSKINKLNKTYNLPAENNKWTLKTTLWSIAWIILLILLIFILAILLSALR